jgi:lysyl-tRNA synthetase class I
MFNVDDYIFIYKTMILVRALYESGIYQEDKELVMDETDKIMKTLEAIYPNEMKGVMGNNNKR